MGLISSSVLEGIADRAAYQYGLYSQPFDSINVTGGGYYWQRATDGDDPDVEIPLLNTYYTIDTTCFNLSTAFRTGLTKMLQIVTAMETHFTRVGHTGGWDSYLSSVPMRVSDYFNQVYYSAKGQYLLANNVFSESDDTLGTWDYTTGFTDGIDYGNGSWNNRANGSYFAPTQLKAVIDTGSTSCVSLILELSVKDYQNLPTTIQTSAMSGTAGDEFDIGISTDRFLDVTNITVVSGSSSGNRVVILNKKERVVAP